MYIRTNQEVENKEDLRNLVTSIVLRQRKSFKHEQIEDTVNSYLQTSKFHNQYRLIHEVIDNVLDILSRNNMVTCWNGTWYSSDIDWLVV